MKNNKPTPFRGSQFDGDQPEMALSPKFVLSIAKNFTRAGGAMGSIGVANTAVAATTGMSAILVGELPEDKKWMTTDRRRLELECSDADIYGRSFDASVLVPDPNNPDPKNMPPEGAFPPIEKVLGKFSEYEAIGEIPIEALKMIAGVASSGSVRRVRLFRNNSSVAPLIGFAFTLLNENPALNEAQDVPVMGVVAVSPDEDSDDSRKQRKERQSKISMQITALSDTAMLNAAIRMVVAEKKISTAALQKHFAIGFQTASALLEKLVEKGVVQKTGRYYSATISEDSVSDFYEIEDVVSSKSEFSFETPKSFQPVPPAELLTKGEDVIAEVEPTFEVKDKINQVLRDFSIDAGVSAVIVGPSVSVYEVELGVKQKISAITKLANDLQLRLAISDVRIEAPIPGKNAIGIEVPNKYRAPVLLGNIFEPSEFTSQKLRVPFGKATDNSTIFVDLQSAPHLLVAGQTNSGKSIGLNVIITSLLMTHTPETLRLLLIDPKRVEMTPYNGIPHLLCPVITEPDTALSALESVVAEMERRYELLEGSGSRNLDSYNSKDGVEKLPFLVVLIDELADLMLTGDKEAVETAINRIAAKARAVGIHLVLATQRPSVDVITGTIKNNIPSRIAFKVSSQIDSRTILDQKGAEDLIGKGDALISVVSSNRLTRVQCAYVSEGEVQSIVTRLKTGGDGSDLK
jgi:DNA segregation ATPase FtsK/SpoIIIE-like protein